MKARTLKTLFTVLSLMTVFILAACGGAKDTGSEKKEDTNTKTEDTSYTVEHAMGSTTLEKTPEKVVILTNEGTEALLALGVTPVGAVQSWTPNGDTWYQHIAEDMKDVQVVGFETAEQVNLEAIAALKPDLIIGNKMRQEAIYEQLSAIAPTVFADTLRGNWKINFELYAQALNKVEKGQEIMKAYDDRIASLKTELGDKLSQKVSIVRFLAAEVRIYQKDSFSGVILDQLGFARPESQDVNEFAIKGVTKEQIPLMDGDIMFYFTYETGDGKASDVEKDWIEDPIFKNLEVAKKGAVHKIDDVIWNTAGGVKAANLMLDDIEKYFLK
ncbi:iron-siderophore ABC transporter substrate-binding protein [Bacillus sp. 31A1R]|uniref:Iron-siderophore ABC transporter substrate-binding protein n=1 Tax=Robertmurraya mangrovi TaxID=3098077 RepID=A0ABU5IYE9_9BACI|nr:iron-siderophore ABC transporter substrate-binding protein [Bacillus sp. 31A1R]MDZ5472172.1 iron-siderophore ABC transporter substrate-binding protein [Bacillus sp. 31A1R]